MSKKLLVTGASGFLGYHLVETALSKQFEVYAGVRKSSQTAHLQRPNVHVLEMDLTNTDLIKQQLEENGIEYIIHGAAVTRAKTASDYNFSNASLTRNLAIAAAAAQTPIRKFVFISSLAALGAATNGHPVDENTIPQPLTWYGKSKLLAENYLQEIAQLPFIVLRPTAVYGPREKDLLLVVKSVCRGLEVYIGNQDQKLSFVYVKDAASLAVDCLESEIIRQFYNVGDGQIYDRYAFADAVKKATGKKAVRVQLPMGIVQKMAGLMEYMYRNRATTPVLNKDKLQELTAADWSVSIDKAKRDLHYHPSYNLETGMAETVAWYRQQKWI